jgi:predicted nucleotidyltransferase
MSVTPEEAAETLRKRETARRRELDAQFDALQAEAKRIVDRIAGDFRPARIYQWGSLLDRPRFRSYSDIDIAVEGITDAAEWIALERAAWKMTGFPLDLVQLEHIEPEYADIIRGKGRVVYERKD